ncbi:DUF3800 domain-containing protein [Desulfurispirillum indicum]|nr:DUF3800 domain-containing protein [Desulfurispirillum indicum]
MLYIAYLDEFGHIGPYISATDPKHKTHPVFGLGGLVLPYNQVRDFSTYFFKLKNNLLNFELQKSKKHPAKWEKKGSQLYTVKNVEKYHELRAATYRLFNAVRDRGGFLIYVGIEKKRRVEGHDAKKLYHSVLREAIKRLDQEAEQREAQFMLILDQQEENVLRGEIVETASIAMYGVEPRYRLIEPPVQVESHLYQTVQCADWLCGIFGRLIHYEFEPTVRPGYKIFLDYFNDRINQVALRSSIRSLPRPASSQDFSRLQARFNHCQK